MRESKLLELIIFASLFLFDANCQTIQPGDIVGEVDHSVEIINGELVVKIPIPKLKGVNNFLPELDLIYKSNQFMQNREIGMGWSFNGLSEISRCFKSFANDDLFDNVKFDATDRFCLDGQRLVLTKGANYGLDKSEYKTEIESYKRIILYTNNSNDGPGFFKVYTKNNLILTFGSTSDSKFSPVGINVTNKWLLNRIDDYAGNSIIYTYLKEFNFAYLSTIKYANRQITFNYIDRVDVQKKYYASKVDTNINKILKSIGLSVFDSNLNNSLNIVPIRNLELEYIQFGPVKQSILKKVKICYPDSTCTRPLTFEYDGEQGVIETFGRSIYQHNICGTNTICELKQVADMNGDGKMDIVGFGADGIYVSLNMGKYFSSATRWSSEFTLNSGWNSTKHLRYILDVNNDGLPDIVGFGELGIFVGENLKTGFKSSNKWSSSFCYDVSCYQWRVDLDFRSLTDIDNDGYPDVFGIGRCSSGPSGSCVVISYNTAGKSFVGYSSNNGNPSINVNPAFTGASGVYWGINYPFFVTDIDADGFTDLFGFGQNSMYDSKFTDTLISNGGDWTGKNGWIYGTHNRYVIDINNDNLPDIAGIYSDNNVYLGASNLITNKFNYNLTSGGFKTYLTTVKRDQLFSDLNMDGYPDLVLFDCLGVYVMMNSGEFKLNSPKIWNSEINACDIRGKSVLDMDGDGMSDIFEFYDSTSFRVAFNENKKPKLTRIVDSLNNEKKIKYDDLSDALLRKEPSQIPESMKTYGINFDVVSEFSSSDGIGGKTTMQYQYGNYYCNKTQGRSSCTFSFIKYQKLDSFLYFIDEYFLEYPLTGIMKSKQSYLNNFLLYNKTFNYEVRINANNGLVGAKSIYEILLRSNKNDFYDTNGEFLKSEISQFSYDNFGNSYFVIENITNNSNMNYSKISVYEYKIEIANINSWYINQMVSKIENYILQTPTSIESKTIQQRFEYNETTRLLSKKIHMPNTDLALESSYIYNNLGNLISVIDKDTKTQLIKTKYFNFDSNGLNIISSVNEMGHKRTFIYDYQDNLVLVNDSNSLISYYAYNSKGSKIYESKPGVSNVTFWFAWDSSAPNSVYSINSKADSGLRKKTIYDSLNRIIRTVRYGFNSEQIFEDTIYDSNGQIKQKSMPYKAFVSESYLVTFEYDDLLREIKRIEPGKTKNQSNYFMTQYVGLNIYKQNTLGHTRVEKKNILGQIISIEDTLGTSSYYSYDSLNNLVKIVDPQGAVTLLKYNINNMLIYKDDPYMGVNEHAYNAFNELLSTKYANGQSVFYYRDSLGRIIKRSEPEGDTFWTYDASYNGVGKLSRVNSSSISKEYSYDSFGRETEIKTLIGSNNYTVKTQYDIYGRINAYIYPSNLAVYNCYNSNGYLISVSLNDPFCTKFLWKANDYDAMNNLINEEDQNGIKTTYTFNSFSQMTGIKTKSLNNAINRNIEYEYDLKKNLIRRTDYDFRGKQLINKYNYDPLDRLILSTLSEKQSNGIESTIKQSSWNYDPIGNMLYSNEINEKIYVYDDLKKQQPVKIGDENIVHDIRGNIIKTNSYEIIWSSFSKPISIKTNRSLSNYEYGPNRERIVKSSNNQKTVVHYVDDFYEKWIVTKNGTTQVTEKYYIKVLNKIIATKILTKSGDRLFYMYNDAYGSVESISDDKGVLLVKYLYTSFGYRSISYSNISADLQPFLSLGYGSNDYVDDERLIFFKGRIYDCVFSRFLSPDPFIQEPYNIQNLNRYSYSLNNPFKYNDPSGFFWKKLWKTITNPKLILAVVAAVATAGALAPYAAGVGAALTSSTLGASIISGAIVGAGTGFTSSLILSNGNLNSALKGALAGGISGGIGAGIGAIGSSASKVLSDPSVKFAGDTVFNGVKNRLDGKNFFDGFDLALLSFGAGQAYQKVVGYDATFESGGPAANKGYNTPPVQGANNIGTQGGPPSFFSEGGPLSEALNKVGGINAVAGLHDVFQISLSDKFFARDILNVPGMPVAAAITYASLYSKIQCPMCSN